MDVEQASVDTERATVGSAIHIEVVKPGLSLCTSERVVIARIAK
jgi:hypothetical protein